MKLENFRTLLPLVLPSLLSGISVYIGVRYNTDLTPRELSLVQAVQFVASLWFGWAVSSLFSQATFHDQQRKFAISAFRRISEIEGSVNRLLRRIDTNKSTNKIVVAELDVVKELAIGLRATVVSSKADWGDIIGDEIRTLQTIQDLEARETTPEENTSEKVESLLASLPAMLEIQARQGMEGKLSDYVDDLEEEFKARGHVSAEGFWDMSFEKDIWDMPVGAKLKIYNDDAGTRVGALIAHDEHGNKVGVITNGSEDLKYFEFAEALSLALNKSKFDATYVRKGVFIADEEGERHYFDVQLN